MRNLTPPHSHSTGICSSPEVIEGSCQVPGSPQAAAEVVVSGIPQAVPAAEAIAFRSRLETAAKELLAEQKLRRLDISIRFGAAEAGRPGVSSSANAAASPTKYIPREPLFRMELLVIPADVRDQLIRATRLLELRTKIFEEWGLREIEPNPRSALNFYGPPGTGKTMAAHALAAAGGKNIICASYADIESMYHGEGPKNVSELFQVAAEQDAVLFIDEADSLLSKRLTNVTQGSEQAINSMRSQLLISLDNFKGLVIFATNLVANYDTAFDSRVQHVHFPVPGRDARVEIWRRHLPKRLPTRGVDCGELAEASEGLVGRDIKMAVISAATRAAMNQERVVTQEHLLLALANIRQTRVEKESAGRSGESGGHGPR